MKYLSLSLAAALFLAGCTYKGLTPQKAQQNTQVVVQKIDKDDLRQIIKDEKLYPIPDDVILTANGEGIAPQNALSVAQSQVLAKRAAMAAAYANLAGKLYGVKIDGEDTIKDAMLQNSRINARVQGLVKNAAMIDEGFVNGLYKVTLQLRINQDKWQEVFGY